jgi:hypothetical protein
MKPEPIIRVTAFSTALFLLFLSCKKELSCEDCDGPGTTNNQSPVACAGTDQIITLPPVRLRLMAAVQMILLTGLLLTSGPKSQGLLLSALAVQIQRERR